MSVDLLIIAIACCAFGLFVGLAVRYVLKDRATRKAAERTDAVDRMMRHGGLSSRFVTTGRRRELREGLPDALDMLSNSLMAGLTLPQAMLRNLDHLPTAIAEEFAHVLYDMRLGYSIGAAFDNMAGRLKIPDFQMVAIAAKIGVEHGGKLHENFHTLSTTLRNKLSFERELHAMTTEGRMQALVMSCLPVAMMLILSLIQPDLIKPLFTTALGWATLALLAGMQGIAYVWIRKIVNIEA